MPIDLTAKMVNGGSVRDWLGTTMVALNLAADDVKMVRRGYGDQSSLIRARIRAKEALDELDLVISEVTRDKLHGSATQKGES